jgi:hypothetical protein
MDFSDVKKLGGLSPFELKDALIQVARRATASCSTRGAATRTSWRPRRGTASSSSACSP